MWGTVTGEKYGYYRWQGRRISASSRGDPRRRRQDIFHGSERDNICKEDQGG